MKNSVRVKMISLFILIIIAFSSLTNVSYGKYVLIDNGVLAYSFFTNKITTGTFVVTDEALIENNTATSENKFGLSMTPVYEKDENGNDVIKRDPATGEPLFTINGDNWRDYEPEDLNEDILFTVQNDTQHTLIIMFNVILCLGYTSAKLTTTIKESVSGVGLTVTLGKGSDSYDQSLAIAPNITVDLEGIIQNNYSAYQTTVNPADYAGTDKLSRENLNSFLLINPGETKSYTLHVEYQGGLLSWLDRACYAQLTMMAMPYTP